MLTVNELNAVVSRLGKATVKRNLFLCKYMKKLFFILMLINIFFSNTSKGYSIDDEEFAFIPEYCDYTQYGRLKELRHNPPKNIKPLIDKVGKENWEHIHHYCMALVNIYRSYKVGLVEYQRRGELFTAIGGIDYVLKNSSRDLVIRPELLTKKGYVFILLNEYSQAIEVLNAAIEEGKQRGVYWPSYSYLADAYLAQGQIDKAKAILEQGLKIAPNAKGLRKRLFSIENRAKHIK